MPGLLGFDEQDLVCEGSLALWLATDNASIEARAMNVLEHPAALPTLMTSGVGLFVFVGTQIVLHLREETKLLRERLEKLMDVLGDLVDANHQRIRHTMKLEEDYQSGNVDYIDHNLLTLHSIEVRLTTLVDFYFPDLAMDAQKLVISNRRVSGFISEGQECHFRSFSSETFEALGLSVAKEADVFRRRILAERQALIRTFRGRLRKWWINKCDGH